MSVSSLSRGSPWSYRTNTQFLHSLVHLLPHLLCPVSCSLPSVSLEQTSLLCAKNLVLGTLSQCFSLQSSQDKFASQHTPHGDLHNQPKSSGAMRPLAVSWNRPFFFISCLSWVFCYRDRKQTKTGFYSFLIFPLRPVSRPVFKTKGSTQSLKQG